MNIPVFALRSGLFVLILGIICAVVGAVIGIGSDLWDDSISLAHKFLIVGILLITIAVAAGLIAALGVAIVEVS